MIRFPVAALTISVCFVVLLFTAGESFALPSCQDDAAIWHDCSGTWTYDNGDKYVGEWRDDKTHGQGTLTFADGGKYVGEWKDGRYHGQGTLTSADGGKYVGEFRDYEKHGQGTFTAADGGKYVGEYRDDKRHGQGTLTFADGRKYVGEWKDGKYHGQGTLTSADGEVQEGIFKDGEFHSPRNDPKVEDPNTNIGSAKTDEVLVNKEGNPVLLKDDGTWELIPDQGEDGKVVFMVKEAKNHDYKWTKEDEMGDFSHYRNIVGCRYTITVKNNTKYKVKVNTFKIGIDNKVLFNNFMLSSAFVQFGELLEPGQTFTGYGQHEEGSIVQEAGDTNELATEEQLAPWISKYGCEAQRGLIYLFKVDIGFSKASGIANNARRSFLMGSSRGMYPLRKEIKSLEN